jgi:hypothetical protein
MLVQISGISGFLELKSIARVYESKTLESVAWLTQHVTYLKSLIKGSSYGTGITGSMSRQVAIVTLN